MSCSYESWSVVYFLRCGPAPQWLAFGSRQAHPNLAKLQRNSPSVDTWELILLITGWYELKGNLVEWKGQLTFEMGSDVCVMSSPAPSHSALTTTFSGVATASCPSYHSAFFFFFFLNFWFANNTKQPSEGSWDLSYFWFLDYFSHPLRVKILGKLEARTSNSFAFHGIHVQKWRGWLAKHNTKKHEDSKYIFKCSKILLIMTRNDFCFFFNGWRSKHCFYKSLHLRRCQH